MRRILTVSLALCLISGVCAAKSNVSMTGLRFGAPTVNDKGNVYGAEVGDIVYDSSDSKFYGYSQTGSWIDLSVGGTGDLVPVGTVMPYAGATAPSGFLLTDGSAVSRTAYPALFAAIGTTYGSGDGSTTFNLPNTQGIFVKGAGSQTISSVNYSGTLGAKQTDQFQGHKHSISDPGHDHGVSAQWTASSPYGGGSGNLNYGGTTASATTGVTVENPSNDGSNGSPRTGAETRPANISLHYIIKY